MIKKECVTPDNPNCLICKYSHLELLTNIDQPVLMCYYHKDKNENVEKENTI